MDDGLEGYVELGHRWPFIHFTQAKVLKPKRVVPKRKKNYECPSHSINGGAELTAASK